ncbi:carotenoid oxygenase family protein [Streptomyces sp. SRF1]|uniref:carotenoid oxygenase family protein n=1 Tax=Streptomyces sp. SRF1 TaxID=1549642 RepID=UPI0025AF5A2C|nr:carotenoid oxygenase family protein [Streptomyces sp. SRF1]MDN3057542.1 carotenoid oxygenase family protein [Streptomyces sp. SRF1]
MSGKPYLSGHYAPLAVESTARDLTVHGSLPPELTGRYLRNGHNPPPGVVPSHWFKGSGMVHGVRLRDGRAEWYRNRWVRTPALHDAVAAAAGGAEAAAASTAEGADGAGDLTASVAGTHVIEHAGRVLALQEANLPYELTPELATVGAYDFGGKLTRAMTAHPKEDPVSGELYFFSYSPVPPHLVQYVASPDGRIVREETIEGAGPSLMHDFGLTEHFVVWLDLPVVFDPAERSGIPYRWSDDYRPRIGVMPRTGPPRVTWCEVEPGALLHVANAYEDAAGRIVVEGPRYDRAAWQTSWKWWTGAPGHAPVPLVGSVHHRWILDPASGGVREEPLDDLVTEFPTINDSVLGRPSRYGYAVAFPGAGLEEYALVKYDTATGARQIAPMGPGRMPGEAVFVPADGSGGGDDGGSRGETRPRGRHGSGAGGEDDGYLLTIVSDLRRDASELIVLDAHDIAGAPVATVELPHRVPAGIHGSWIPDPAPGP